MASVDLQLNKDYLGGTESYQQLYANEKKAADLFRDTAIDAAQEANQAKADVDRWKAESGDLQKALAEAVWNVDYYSDLYKLQVEENRTQARLIKKLTERIDEQALEISALKKRIKELDKMLDDALTKLLDDGK